MASPDPPPKISDLRLEAQLGEGVFSQVYRADRDGQTYAVKIQRPTDPDDDTDTHTRFIREAATLARLSHPSLPHVWTIGEVDGRHYMVMDFIEGDHLDELTDRQSILDDDLARIGLHISQALAELHGAGLVHRDIKPSNIIWDGERAHLVDFGLVGPAVDHLSQNDADGGAVIGTLAYASPEQLRAIKRPVDARSDLYSLGAVLYDTIAGSPPYDDTDLEALLRAHAAEQPPSLADDPDADYSAPLRDIVDTLIAKEPSLRFQSALQTAEAFGQFLDDPDAQSDPDIDTTARVQDLETELARVGRADELDRISRSWSFYRQIPNGFCCLVVGHEGLGRNEVITEALDDLDDAEITLRANLERPEDSQPLDAIYALFEAYLYPNQSEQIDDDRLASLQRATEDFNPSEPVRRFLRRLLGTSSSDASPTPTVQTHQFIGEVARLLGSLADDHLPSVIAVDRVESLDLTSRMVIRRLSYLLTQFDLFLIASVDPDAPGGHDFYQDLLNELTFLDHAYDNQTPASADPGRQHPSASEITLAPLSTDDVQSYLSLYLNADFNDTDFANHLRATSGGSPIILSQLLDVLIERRVIQPDWDGWRVNRDRWQNLEIPGDTHALLTDRLDDIDSDLLALGSAAAVWGQTFPLPPLADALDWSRTRAAATAERGQRRDLFVAPTDDSDAYRFVHSAVRDAFLDRTADKRRRRLHQFFAEFLDRPGSLDRQTSWSFDLAWHFANGNNAAPERTFDTCWRAGRRAADDFAFEQTLTFLQAARRAAESLDRQIPAELDFLLGLAHAELGDFDDAERCFERAVDHADSPLDEARYQLRWADIDATRLEVDPVERRARRALELLDHPLPVSHIATLLWLAPRLLWNQLRERTRRPAPAQGERRLSLQLRSRAFDLLGMAAVFGEQDLLSLCAEVGRLYTALQLGASPELVGAYASSATVNALLGRRAAAHRKLQHGRDITDDVHSPYATLKLELTETWVDHILGDPVDAAARAVPILRHRADQLSLLDRSVAIEEISVNFALRGFSHKVQHWFERWYKQHPVQSDRWPPSTLYSTALVHARLCGDNDTADDLREVSRESVRRQQRSIYFRKSHLSAITFDNVLLRESPEAVEIPLQERLDLGADPTDTVFWAKTFFIYAGYARRYLLDHPDTSEREQRLEAFEIAIQRLESSAQGHPTLRAHANVLRAGLAARKFDADTAYDFLSDAERLAIEHRNQWVLYEVSLERARLLRNMYPDNSSSDAIAGAISARHLPQARDAADIARDLGWTPRARRVRQEFDLLGSSSATSSTRRSTHPSGNDPTSGLSTRQIELQRKLDALLDVSMATSSLIDPDEVSDEVVDAAIRVLGAERGFLFLHGDDDALEQREPRVIRVSDNDGGHTSAANPDQQPTYSQTVIDQVARTGDAVVVRGTREGADLGADSIVTHNIRSVIAAPLFFDERMVGAIYLDNRLAGGVFDESDVEVLQAIANHIPVALETARTAQLEVEVATERERRAYAESLRSFTQDVNELLDVSSILAHLIDELASNLRVTEAWGLRLSDHSEPTVLAHYQDGEVHCAPFDPDDDAFPSPGDIVASLTDNPSVQTISPVSERDRRREPFISDATQSWVAVPLGTGQTPVGLAILASEHADAFPPAEIEQALALADQAGVAIEKAMLANNDPLTGVFNRRKFFDIAGREFERCERNDQPLCALLLDVDNFKAINDEFGHAAGDKALEQLADICESSVRRYDTVARYGGEEFAVLLPSTPLDEARDAVAERLRQQVEQTNFTVGDATLSLTVSIGLAERDASDDDPHALLERADDAMYLAKRRGKNLVSTYDELN